MTVVRWILGWSVGLAVPAGVLVFVAGPEEAAHVARDAWGGVREAASEAWDGLSSGDGPGPDAPGRDAPEEEWGVVAGRTSFHGMVCEWEEDIARIVDEGEFLSALEARVRSHVAITGRPNVTRRGFEVGLASPPPSTLPLGMEVSTGTRWLESSRGQWIVKEGTVEFSVSFPCNYISVTGLEGITEAVIPPPANP